MYNLYVYTFIYCTINVANILSDILSNCLHFIGDVVLLQFINKCGVRYERCKSILLFTEKMYKPDAVL